MTVLNGIQKKSEMMKITFEDLTRFFAWDTQQKFCCEVLFCIKGSAKFDACWMGKYYDKKDKRDVFWFGLTADGENAYVFFSFEEMANAKVFDGSSLKELCENMDILSIDSCVPEERLPHYFV